jgi:hypothetical protein
MTTMTRPLHAKLAASIRDHSPRALAADLFGSCGPERLRGAAAPGDAMASEVSLGIFGGFMRDDASAQGELLADAMWSVGGGASIAVLAADEEEEDDFLYEDEDDDDDEDEDEDEEEED